MSIQPNPTQALENSLGAKLSVIGERAKMGNDTLSDKIPASYP
jgi:hypothetical protein